LRKIRIVVGKMPRLLRDIFLTSLARRADLEVVSTTRTGTELRRVLDSTNAEFLILHSADTGLAPDEEGLVSDLPRLRVLVLDTEGREGALYETVAGTGLRKVSLHDVSMEQVEGVIRASWAGGERPSRRS
jgi:hypothetical protein